jgi:hypothetical protein
VAPREHLGQQGYRPVRGHPRLPQLVVQAANMHRRQVRDAGGAQLRQNQSFDQRLIGLHGARLLFGDVDFKEALRQPAHGLRRMEFLFV